MAERAIGRLLQSWPKPPRIGRAEVFSPLATRYAGKTNAPDFPPGAEWLNTPRPLSIREFAGKLLVLDFWTYCCINCMHTIPVLGRLERDHPEELAVVGVHSAKFDEERSTENIRQAIMRYGVRHPVVNDAGMDLWRAYAVHAWPTVMFVDPEGKVIGKIEGELTYERGTSLIAAMLTEFRAAGVLKPSSAAAWVPEEPRASVLSYPGKVLADIEGERLFIADSGHHRVLVTDLAGTIQTVIGTGEAGLADGMLEGAQFNRPQGMARFGEALYVADTGNHAIRVIDLEAATVETIAGTGTPGERHVEGGAALEVDLRSPWDLALAGRRLHIAMAGSHQIWTLDLDGRVVQATVGTGAESIVDGPPEEALLAQPSGIAVDEEGVLYFVDAETSSVRSADLTTAHHVSTLVGTGLFDFGDVDGDGASARLQHPLGIDLQDGVVYVADTYNSKIKRLSTGTRAVETVAGSGERALRDGALATAAFYEPGGLSIAGDRIYVADTNNHALRLIDLAQGQVTTLDVDF
ncbi:MAG: redoxin domain-containing protein [Chloroflexi bacterium]|nr:redoxin domain-containing protein [Chloroflexota bacterium]